ncbi:MAG: acylneuraminate cytidylyltransferase family protein [Magnetococcales bacterium]|nr:acylneuraminate cytidylyltransferase family protein [Magnetococcales bacterium]
MIRKPSLLGLIPARGGSKGIPRKNVAMLGDKPLLAWTIETARRCRVLDRFILSSEDEEIIAMARHYQCEVPFVRPAELAQDDTPGMEVVFHALNALEKKYDYVVVLQPTSPFRLPEDVEACFRMCLNGAPAVMSVAPARENPGWMYRIGQEGVMTPLMGEDSVAFRRQALPPVFILNGAVHMAKTDWLHRTGRFLTPETRAYRMSTERSVDIDAPLDLALARAMLEE